MGRAADGNSLDCYYGAVYLRWHLRNAGVNGTETRVDEGFVLNCARVGGYS